MYFWEEKRSLWWVYEVYKKEHFHTNADKIIKEKDKKKKKSRKENGDAPSSLDMIKGYNNYDKSRRWWQTSSNRQRIKEMHQSLLVGSTSLGA